MLPAEFEPAVPANDRPQIDALERATTSSDPIATYSGKYIKTF